VQATSGLPIRLQVEELALAQEQNGGGADAEERCWHRGIKKARRLPNKEEETERRRSGGACRAQVGSERGR